jgi:all-trans-8'-apo-beta-carotenal 15,15'-oxygenase
VTRTESIETQDSQALASSNQDAPSTTSDDFAPGLEGAFLDEFEECDTVVQDIQGAIPDFVRGACYLNGPARFRVGQLAYRHWLDGDGMVCMLRFGKDEVRFRSRYVRTRKFTEERAAGRPLFRVFGTELAGGMLNRANNGLESPANVSVYPMGRRLLAFGEQGLPWELDPENLETRGQFTFGGRLNDASPFAAHPKFDPETGEMFNFGIFFSPHSPRLYFYCFAGEALRYRQSLPLENPCSVHDFSLSKNYAVFYLSPYLLNVSALLQHKATVIDSLEWRPDRGSSLLIVARQTGSMVASIPIGDRHCLHMVNSFERNGELVVDVLEFDAPLYGHYAPLSRLFEKVSLGRPVRFVLDLKSWEVKERKTIDYCNSPDFPAIDPGRVMMSYDDFWMLGISAAGKQGRKFFDQLVHADWREDAPSDIYQSPPMRYLAGEPLFLGNSGRSQAVVLCQEFDAKNRKSAILIFDAQRVSKGPIARLGLEKIQHLGFHSVFLPG